MRSRWPLTLFGLIVSLGSIDLQPYHHPNDISDQQPPYHRGGGTALIHDGRCALIIPTGDYNHGSDACVTYESVDRAFSAALERMKPPSPKGRSMTDTDIDNLGHVLVETSRILAQEYNLYPEAIHSGLPLIDTRRTLIDRFCPAYLKRPKCAIKRYREYNGMCNNLENAHWGATLAPYRRLLPPAYADSISQPRISVTGNELPTARYVSARAHRDLGYHDHAVTVYLPAWGQLIDHDMTQGGESKDPETDAEPKCCDRPADQRHPACWPVEIPDHDPFYSLFRRKCMEFVRSATGLQEQCKLGPRSTMNTITSILDANFVYGASKETADSLRAFKGGLLASNPENRHLGLKDLLPPKLTSPDAGCARPNNDTYCFLAGDSRANQQMMLVAQHTIFMREHNRMAVELGQINPHWDDEKIFQETRHIMAAVVQHITYNEFLPMVLGRDVMERYGLLLLKDGHASFYNPKLDPTLPVSFFAAAYRFGHSLIPGAIERWSVSHQYVGARRLSEMLLRPFDVYQAGTCDQYLSGFMNQVSQAVDESMTQELTNHLFQDGQNNWGLDLASLNMQRGRDHGLPGYNAFREYCGLNRAYHWNDLADSFTNETLIAYSQIYASPDDIDLWSAGVSERPLPGSMVGPVFGCIMGETFKNLRYGDRFWYENGGWPSSFTLDQLNEIRKIKLSRIICDNSDNLESSQVYVMVLPDYTVNPRVPCKSAILPRINLEFWRDNNNYPTGYDGLHDDIFNTDDLFRVPPGYYPDEDGGVHDVQHGHHDAPPPPPYEEHYHQPPSHDPAPHPASSYPSAPHPPPPFMNQFRPNHGPFGSVYHGDPAPEPEPYPRRPQVFRRRHKPHRHPFKASFLDKILSLG